MYASAKSRGIILMVDRDFSFCCASDSVHFVVFLVVVDLFGSHRVESYFPPSQLY